MKKIFSAALVPALAVWLAAVAAAAAMVQTASVFKLSENPSEPFQITAVGNKLIFEGLPDTENFNYVMVGLTDENGNDSNENYLPSDADRSVTYAVPDVADGIYYIQIYTSPTEYGTYKSYIFGKKLKIEIKNRQASFVMPPVFKKNLDVYTAKRTDSLAQSYYLKPSYGIQSDDAAIVSLAKTITKGLTDDYQKTMAIHDWVCENIWYDYDVFYGKAPYGDASATGTLKSKRNVCQGYASLMAALLRASGIPAKLVTGYALGLGTDGGWTDKLVNEAEPNHAWNEAFVGGRWIIIDATWNSGNEYKNGVFEVNEGLRGHTYFDISLEAFSNDHRIDNYSESGIPALTAAPTSQKVFVNGRQTAFDAYEITGNNYFKLRDLAKILSGTGKQFEVGYDTVTGAVTISSGKAYTSVGGEMAKGDGKKKTPAPSANVFYLDGKRVTITSYLIGGNNYLKLRDIMSLLNVYVGYDGTVIIDTSKGYPAE